ncbi:MAG: hypothetical protein ACJ8D7_05610 [Xanthobacteraceae bacterium]
MPIAIAGLATLLVAALAMSGFSVLVAANDVRPCRLLLLGASMVHSAATGHLWALANFQLHSGRFQKPGQMPYDLRDRGAEIAISNGVEPGRGALRLLITDG